MGIFGSLGWFKSEKKKEMEALEIEEQKLKVQVLKVQKSKLEADELISKTLLPTGRPYVTIKLVNDMLTVVLNDGNILCKPGATKDDYMKARVAKTEEELFKIASSGEGLEEKRKEEKEIAKKKALIQGVELLKDNPDFEVKEDAVYLKGINRSLPQLLVEKFIELSNVEEGSFSAFADEYVALKRFFMWCCLNPRAEVADKLYDFLVRNSFKITKQGFFTALRNVVTVEGDNELVKFVSQAYNKVKAVWKKSPKAYHVYKDEEGELKFGVIGAIFAGEQIGGLEDLYLDLPNMKENRFTDAHTGSFDIRIGQVVTMPPDQCHWNTDDCGAAGLHFTANEINYVGCGDTSVLVLINPMKVVGIGQSKGRCYEYLPIMTVPREESTVLLNDLDFDTLELDEIFAISELDGLVERAKEGFAVEAKKHSFNIPQISSQELVSIVSSLEDMKASISGRVVEFV